MIIKMCISRIIVFILLHSFGEVCLSFTFHILTQDVYDIFE